MEWITLIPATMSAVAAIAACFVAYRAFRWQTEIESPKVIVYACSLVPSTQFLHVKIVNVGKRPAFDVVFAIDGAPDKRLLVYSTEKREFCELRKGPLVDGISTLASGDSREIFWGRYDDLYKQYGDRIVRIRADFKDERRKKCSAISSLDLKSYYGVNAADNSPSYNLIEEMKKLNASLQAMAAASGVQSK